MGLEGNQDWMDPNWTAAALLVGVALLAWYGWRRLRK